jgi:Stage II sporulation protein E (SpoIIE)
VRTGTRQTTVALPGRAQLCFYTDGLTEARVGSELFGAARLTDALAELGPRATAPALLARVAERADARPDDMAACVLSVTGDERQPVVALEQLELDREDAASERTERFLLECGVERRAAAEAIGAAGAAVASGGTVVLELRHTGGRPEVVLQREQLSYIHARRASVEVAL